MSFSDWTKKRKKQDEDQENTQGSTGARATASPAAAPSQGGSFADWTKQQAASGAVPASGSYARDDKPSSFSEWTRRNKGVTAWRDEEVGFNSWLENLNSFSQRMSADYAGRDGKYQSADTLGAYRDSAYQSIDSFNSQAANYRNYFQAYKSMYDDMYGEGTVDRILSALDEGGSYLEGLRGGLGSEFDYWSQWATEKDYDDYQRRSALDIDSAKLELAELEPQLAQAEKDRNTYRGIMSGSRYMTAQQQAEYAANYQDAETRYNDLQGRVTALQEDIDGAERIAQGKQYSAYREADDFAELSRYATTANGKEAKFNAWSGMYTETGFDDITYDYINRNEEALGHQTVNDISSNASLLGVDNSFLQEMTDDEIATFNYIYATQGADQAYAYISFIANDLTYRQRAASEAEWAAYANEHPIGSSVFSVLESPLKGVSYLGQVADYAEDGKIDQNAAYNKFSYLNSAIRGEVNSIVEDKWGGVGSFAYQTGMSMGDFLFNTAITGGNSALTLGIMGTGAAADATISAKDRGMSDDQAFALGTIAGAAEIITEKVSLDALLDKTSLSRSALGYFLKNTLAEGSEEVGSDFINLFADILIAKDKSEWQQSIDAYQREGMDESEAFWHAVLDQAETMGLDFLGGAISGGVMSGGAIGINAVGSNINTRQTGAEFQAMGEDVVQAIIQEGLASDPSTQSYQLAQQLQQKLDNGETITNAELGRLYQANVQAIDAEEGAGDLLLRAAEELTQKGRVTNNMALDILDNPRAMTTLETEAGLTITENMSKAQQRKAVKSAVEALASREGGVSAAVRETAKANPQGAQTAAQPATQTEQRRTAQPVNIARQAHNIQGLSQAAQALGQQGAKVAADFYDGTTDTTAYYGAFSAYYQAGMTGMDMDKVRTAYTDALNDAQRQAAYLAGKNDAAASLAQEKARVQYATVYGEEAGLIQNDHTATLPKAQAVYLNNLGKALGTKIEMTAAVEHGGNGAYYVTDGTIRIAANAQDPALVVASHEITHRLQDLAPEAYRKYRDYANGKIAEQVGRDAVEEIKDRYARHGVNLTTEQAMDEVAAEFTEAMVKDGKLFQNLAQDNRSVARKVLDAIRDFIRRVKSAFRGDAQSQNSAAMEQYGVDMKTLEEAARLWNDALKEANASARSLSSVVGTEGSYAQVDGKFSLKGVVEDNGELLALHNLTEKNLRDALKLGGLPMPSIAIVQAQQGHAKYGPISLVFGTDTIDPQADSRNRVYGGDAWTPTAPTVDRVVNDKVASRLSSEIYKKAQKIADGLFLGEASSALYFENEYTSKTMDDILDDLSNNDGVRAAYLADQGKTLEPVMRDKVEQFDSFGNEALSDLAERMGTQELAAAYARTMTGEGLTDGDISAVKAAIRGALERRGGFTTNSPAKVELRLNRLTSERMVKFIQNAWDLHEAGGGSVEQEVDRYATSDALRDMVDQDDLRLWLEKKLDGLLGEAGIYNGKDPFTASGNRRGFAALHNAYTLENIVKAMTSQQAERGEGAWGVSAKTMQSVSTPSYRNIKEIKADSGRLGAVEGDAYEARVEAVDQQISSIIQKVKATNKAHSDNSFIESDIIGSVLMETAKGKHTVDAIMRTFSEEGYKISSQTAQDIQAVYKAAAELPTEYFEAKPRRAVGFDEVLAAVVPDDLDAGLRTEAESAGMRLLEYKAGDDADRLAKVNSVEGARFSIKEDSKGRELTEAQQEYFRGSKAVDAEGRLLTMYHGTRKGGFTVFRGWSYLTANKDYATKYVNRDTGDTMYEVYANIRNPFDTRLPECRELFDSEYTGNYSNTPLQDSGLPDWTDGYDLAEFIEENDYGYDAILLDEGADPATGERIISYVVRNPEQIKNVTNKTPTNDPDIRYSLKPVDPVEPTTDAWTRGATFDEVKAAHPTLFALDADEADTRNPTQISGTVKTYRKIYDTLQAEGFNGTILDASSGLGYGTLAGREEYGFRVDDIEPFPDAKYKPMFTDYSALNKTYDVIINNAVLNVMPQDLRDALVVKMGEMLNPGGRAFINVRGTDVKNASSKVAINDDLMEYFISNTGSYQKGFTSRELVAYLKDALGDGFTVEAAKGFGGVSAIVTRSDARLSLQEKSTMRAADVKALYEENNLLRERVDYWKGQTRRTKRVTTDKKAVASAARELIRSYGADLAVDDISGDLQSLYDYIASGRDGADELTYTEARRRAEAIAARLVNSAVAVDDEMYRQYGDLRSYLRTTKLTISEADSHDIADYGDFRRRNMGRINLGKGSTNIDRVYQEMSELWPEFFDDQRESTPADQLLHIAEVLDGIYDITEYNPFSRYTEQAVTGAANEIMEQFFDLPQTRATFADRQAMKLQEAKAKGRQQLQRLREQNNAKLETLREQNRERVQRAIERERSRRDTQIGQLKERYAAKDAAGRERRSAAELRRKITRHASSLSQKLLHPTDKQHIPENLRGAVAAMLESINQESRYTVDPETGKRRKGDDGLPTKRTEAFRALKEQYAKIVAEGGDLVIDPSLLGSDAEGIQGSFDAVIAMKDTRLADMTTAQLETVWKVVKAVEHSVSTAGKVLSKGKYAQTQDWAQAMEADTATRRAKRSLTKGHAMIDLETPYTFFSHYGEAGHAVYRTLRNAQDQQQLMVDRVAEEVRKIVDPKTVKTLEEATHTFTTERGEKLTLSTAQIMELYELTKRKQAQDHLLKGGIVQPEIKSANIRRGTDAILLTAGDLETITGKLTDKQAKIADGLQKLTTGLLADYGNQASMTAYGYKKFTGTDYWPIKSAKEGIHSTVEKGGNNTRSIKNIGLAKSVMPHASNPLDIAGIFSTFSAHAADMTDYAAWLCTMEDLNRLYNFRFRDGEGSLNGKTVKGILDRVGGTGAQKYWNNLMEDIQNGINASSDSPMWDIVGKTIGSFKGAAVGANLRVVIQQPTAFFRAGAVLSPADLSRGLARGVTKGNGWAKALQYSPIAMRKDMGGFDISSPMQMNELLFDSRTRVRKLNDALSAPAGMADAVTWGRLWNACEWSTAREHKELAKGSEAFYKAVNELFTEVIDQTQVVDGVLQRSNIMRSSNAVVKQATSFMGEPIMSLNLLMRSYDQVRYEQNAQKRGRAIKTMGRAATALVVTNVVNALAQSLIDAMRDDDEDKKYWERFRSAFTGITGEEESTWDKAVAAVFNGNVGSNMNLLGQIPFVKDALSMLQGYDVSRTEMEIIADLIEAGQTAVQSAGGAGKKTRAYAAKELLAAGAKVFGIPLGNLARDVWGLARSVTVEADNIPLQYEMEKAIYNITNSGNKGRYYDILFRALAQGDMNSYQHIRSELMDMMGMDGASIDSAMRSRYNKALENDPNFTLSQQACDLIGSRDQYAEDEEAEASFGAGDLGTQAYQAYADQRAGNYREMADGLDQDPVFQSMSDEEKDKVLAAAYKLADKTALADNSGGQYEIDTKWMALADDAEAMGIEPWEYVLFHVAYNMAESTKDENGKTVNGEAKSDHVREWLEDYAGLTDAQREFLWGTVYTGEW